MSHAPNMPAPTTDLPNTIPAPSVGSGDLLAVCSNCKHWRRGGRIDRVTPESTEIEILIKNPPAGPWMPHNIAVITDGRRKTGLCLHVAIGSDYVDGWLNRKCVGCRPDGIYAEDDEGRAVLATGESFGCIHFSANTVHEPQARQKTL